MSPIGWLVFWAVAFFASHLTLSHPLRAPLVSRLGSAMFQALYSIVAVITFVMAVRAYMEVQEAPGKWEYLWDNAAWSWAIATILMWLGSILFVGSLVRNPALPHPEAKAIAARPASGVYAITRHPMMWGFALWGITHIIVKPTMPSIILSGMIIATALLGAAGQDIKKAKLMGEAWQDWAGRTRYWPFANGPAMPGLWPFVGGTILFLLATYGHAWFGSMAVGPWVWL